MGGNKIKVIIDEKGKKFLVDIGTFHSNKGVVDVDGIKERVASHMGHEFIVLDPDTIDIYERMPRAGSIMLKKDIGIIISHLGIGSGDCVIDAGSGSGSLAIFIGNIVGPKGRVVSYEKSAEFAEIAKSNIKRAGLKDAVEIRVKDVQKGFDDADCSADSVTLDMHEAWKMIDEVRRVLKRGGRISVYNPYIEHSRLVHMSLLEKGFIEVKTLESTMREIEFREQGSRPKTSRVGHSGYLTFGRKV